MKRKKNENNDFVMKKKDSNLNEIKKSLINVCLADGDAMRFFLLTSQ